MKHRIPLLFIAAIALLTPSCATDSGNVSADRRGRVTNAILSEIGKAVGSVLVSTLENAATDAISGRKVDFANGMTTGLYSKMGTIINSGSIGRVMEAWGGDDMKPVTAIATAKVKEVENVFGPFTAKESTAILTTIAGAISKKSNP